MHPFLYNNHKFETEMEIVNQLPYKLNGIPYLINTNDEFLYSTYQVNVGDDIIPFITPDFLRGLITGANWNNLDPKTFITNLKRGQGYSEIWIDLSY